MNKAQLAVTVLLLFLLLAACAPKAVPAPQAPAAPVPQALAPAPAVASAAPAKPAWEVEWEKTLEAAKKEGRTRINLSPGGPVRIALMGAFKGKYGLDLEIVSAGGSELANKVLSERRAGIYAADVHLGGSSTLVVTLKPKGVLDPLEPALILPEVTDPEVIKKTWWRGELGWADKDHLVLVMMADPRNNIVINTDLIKPEEIKAYPDLLNPKYHGKIIMPDPSTSGEGGKWFGSSLMSGAIDLDYMRKLSRQEPFITRDRRLLAEWLARGKYAIAVAADPASIQEFRDLGAPLQAVMPAEGTYISSSFGNVGLINRAPHPNAAKLFINWLLTKDAQTVYSRVLGQGSRRLDVPTDHLPSTLIRQPGVKYFDAETEQVLLELDKYYNVAKELFSIGK